MNTTKQLIPLPDTLPWRPNESFRSTAPMYQLDDQLHVRHFPLLILALVTLAELLTLLPDPRIGVALHIGTLFVLFYHILQTNNAKGRRLSTVLLLMPLIRLISFALPLPELPQISWYVVTSVPLFGSMWLMIRDGQHSWSRQELGLTLNRPLLQLAIAIVGIQLGWMEYQILMPEALAAELTWQALWLPALVLLFCTGYLEELLFRGLLQSAAISVMGRWPGLFLSAALFAVLHIGYASLLDVLFVFAVGLAFGLFVDRTRSLLGVTLAHGLTNIGLFLLWPLWLG